MLRLKIDDSIATITFDREGSGANLFDRETLLTLGERLDEVAANSSLRGLLLRSAKPAIFIAGADLTALSSAEGDQLRELIELGQRTFNRLEDLSIPTVAAIHGACVGGGLELALACDWRVASDASATRIGLPETQLGILPAWGGTTRLPRLLGLPKALPLILSGKLLKAAAAKHKGVVDAVVPREHLDRFARGMLERGRRSEPSHTLIHNPLAVRIIRHRAASDLEARTRGLYPGPQAALEVACEGILESRDQSLARERDAILRLAPLPETRQLLRLFFLRERARKHRPVETEPASIERCAVIGAGVMGSGIAYWLSTRGLKVILRDVSPKALGRGMGTIGKLYDKARSKRVLDATEAARGLDRIHPSAEPVPLHRCQLVIEAASEEMAIKRKIFADLSERVAPGTLLATNTSALPIGELAGSVRHPERLLGLHFFNPVHRMQLVEVVRTPKTSDESIATAFAFVRRIGKLPVLVRDAPGFLVNRILLPYLVEAAELFAQGVDPEEIDRAMLDFGMPMGPLRLLDEVGLDVAVHVAGTLAAAFPERMKVPTVARTLCDSGALGRKEGRGFYDYREREIRPNSAARALQEAPRPAPADLATRLADRMSAEAQRCLDEGIAESADDIDLAMILGTGYAPFRGGPLTHARSHKTHP